MNRWLEENSFARLMITVFGAPLVLGIVVLIGSYFIGETHVLNAAVHLSEEQAFNIVRIPVIENDVEKIETRVGHLENFRSVNDNRITNVENAVLELKAIKTSQDETFTEMLVILRKLEGD